MYPPELAGRLYPDGIPILAETELEGIISRERVQRVVFAYSDVSCRQLTSVMSRVLAAGADFELIGPGRTMLHAGVPVIAVSAVRTGCGKSQTARWLARHLSSRGRRVAVVRHPMPYGDLASQAVQCFPECLPCDADLFRERPFIWQERALRIRSFQDRNDQLCFNMLGRFKQWFKTHS